MFGTSGYAPLLPIDTFIFFSTFVVSLLNALDDRSRPRFMLKSTCSATPVSYPFA